MFHAPVMSVMSVVILMVAGSFNQSLVGNREQFPARMSSQALVRRRTGLRMRRLRVRIDIDVGGSGTDVGVIVVVAVVVVF